jgi:hypothetical protein
VAASRAGDVDASAPHLTPRSARFGVWQKRVANSPELPQTEGIVAGVAESAVLWLLCSTNLIFYNISQVGMFGCARSLLRLSQRFGSHKEAK